MVLLAGCGGGNPMAPTQPSGPNCRTFATQETFTFTSTTSGIPGVPAVPPTQATGTSTCTFERPTATLLCETTTTIGSCTSTSSSATAYLSVDDFVDEATPLGRFLANRVSTSGGNSSVPGPDGRCISVPLPAITITYTYDAQRRPTASSDSTGGGTTYTAWDGSGRPTRGTSNSTVCRSQPFSISYDDVARTIVRVAEPGGMGTCPLFTSMSTYDAMGLSSRSSVTGTIPSPFGDITITTVGTTVVLATAQVCK